MRYVYGKPSRIYKINGKEIESSSQEIDLGISIQENLHRNAHVAKFTSQANRILRMIRSYEDKGQKISCSSTSPLYDHIWNILSKPGDLTNKNTLIKLKTETSYKNNYRSKLTQKYITSPCVRSQQINFLQLRGRTLSFHKVCKKNRTITYIFSHAISWFSCVFCTLCDFYIIKNMYIHESTLL